jgi:hypothetical protein
MDFKVITMPDPEPELLPIANIRFVKELYPRIREDDSKIEQYRTAIENLPPIIIARDGILVDGFHRWQAFKREGLTEIKASNLGNISDTEIFTEAVVRNSTHGHQLTQKDKGKVVEILWSSVSHLGDGRKQYFVKLLSISERTVETYSEAARKDEKLQQENTAKDMWLDCYTQEQIAEKVGVGRKTIDDWIGGFRKLADFANPPESRQHFDVWNFKIPADNNSSYFGRMPPQVVENLLWLYTDPGDMIFDPFAGGGTTIEVSKRMGRPVWASDRIPSTPTLPIHEHDITTGFPADAPGGKKGDNRKFDFVILDPPYWMQAKGKYSDDPEDLGNQDLPTFLKSWDKVVKVCKAHTKSDGFIAFIVSPCEDKENDIVTDLAFQMYDTCISNKLEPKRRIVVTYMQNQANGQQVDWARDNKKLLKDYRDLIVFKV